MHGIAGLLVWEAALGLVAAGFLLRRDARRLERHLRRRENG
jgi:HAMP domain-containing protein